MLEPIIKPDPDFFPDLPTTPEFTLVAAVVKLALQDLKSKHYRDDARRFIESEDFAVFADWLGLDAERIRQALI